MTEAFYSGAMLLLKEFILGENCWYYVQHVLVIWKQSRHDVVGKCLEKETQQKSPQYVAASEGKRMRVQRDCFYFISFSSKFHQRANPQRADLFSSERTYLILILYCSV